MTTYVLCAEGELTALECGLAENTLRVLTRHYPGFTWGVDINGGVISIKVREFVTDMGYRLYILNCNDKAVMMAGGELLERYYQARRKKDREKVREIPRDFRGRHVHAT